jgi:hypothetical protein
MLIEREQDNQKNVTENVNNSKINIVKHEDLLSSAGLRVLKNLLKI